MGADWTHSSTKLPRDGEQVEFVLDFRTVAMHGTYTHQSFHSHWAEYATDRVRSWRNLSPMCDLLASSSDHASALLVVTLDDGARHLPLFAGV